MRKPEPKGNKEKSRLLARGGVDIPFLSIVLVLLTIGLVMLFSASYAYADVVYGDSTRFIVRQAGFAAVGLVAMYVASRLNYQVLRAAAWPLYIFSIVLLVVVLCLPPLQEGFDFKRWIVIGPINFQPSEIAKFSLILLFSSLISLNYKKMQTFRFGILVFGGLLGAVCALVVVEPHLSATVLIFTIGLVLMIVGGIKIRWVIAGGLGGVGLAAVAILTGIVSYGSSRIQYWLDPWAAPRVEGYQTIQSLLAVGSGGFIGRGLGNSSQKYLWVPEPQNDFIFSIVCEELGFVGAAIIVILFGLLVWRGFVIAMRSPDKFGCLLAIGLTFQVGLQAALNMLVVTNTIPNTGISLPFFSYGGTALLMQLGQMGIILSISRAGRTQKT